MILTTKEDFEQAVLKGEEIKTSTVFYTGELNDNVAKNVVNVNSQYPVIGELVERNGNKGIYCGEINGKKIVISLLHFDIKLNWHDAMKAGGDDYRLPTRTEWFVVLENREIINKALKKHGGQEIAEEEWYWSSSEYDYHTAWNVNTINGYMGSYTKDATYPVSCLLAF